MIMYKVTIFLCLLVISACNRSNKNVNGFLVSPNREDRNQYLSSYPNQIDSVILDTFEGKFLNTSYTYRVDSLKVYFAWATESIGSRERQFLDTDQYEVIAYYVIDSEPHAATFVVTKKYKIMLAMFP